MPVYEYKCHSCGKENEVIIGIERDDTGLKCVYCGGEDLSKVISMTARQPQYTSCPSDHTCCGTQQRCHDTPCDSGGGRCNSHRGKCS